MKTYLELPPLSERQNEIITGSLLGDANLWVNVKCPQYNSKFTKGQSKLDKDGVDKISYMNWHYDNLHPYSSKITPYSYNPKNKLGILKKNAYDKYSFVTHAHPDITILEQKWYLRDNNGKHILDHNNKRIKIVPQDIKLTPLSICIWFMDDGYVCPKDANATFCTQGFTKEECNFLSRRLKIDSGIISSVKKSTRTWNGVVSEKPIIYVGRESYFDLLNLIQPHVEWDCFKYKLNTTTYNKQPHRGEAHSLAKLTEEKVRLAFSLKEQGQQHAEIAKQLDVSEPCITMALNGKRWGHLGLCKNPVEKPTISIEAKNKAIELHLSGICRKDIHIATGMSMSAIGRLIRALPYISDHKE